MINEDSRQPLQRFSPQAIHVVQHAKEEARRTDPAAAVDTRHMLLGLLREQGSVAARVLGGLGVTLERAQEAAARHQRRATHGGRSWSTGARRVLEQALSIAHEINARLGRPHVVDTEHLLLALVRDPEGGAVRLLSALGVTTDQVERETLRLLHGKAEPSPAPQPRPIGQLIDVNTRFGYSPNTGLEVTPEQIRRAGEQWSVAHAYTFSLNAALQDAWRGNQETLDLCARESFFLPAAVISPLQHRPQQLVDWVKEKGFAYVRLFPDLHGFAVDGQACRDLLMACGAAGLPVMVPALAAGVPNLLRGLDGIKLTAILTSVRYSILGEVLALAGRLPDLYVETSVLNTPDGVALAARTFGADRLLFGSEYPQLQVGCAALLLQQSGLPPEQLARIGSGNAQRLLEGGSDA